MILDASGQPFDAALLTTAAARRDALESQTELDQVRLQWLQRTWEGHPARNLTPAALHKLLVAAEQGDLVQQLELCEDMEERDGHLFAELDKRAGAVSGLPWSLAEPAAATAAEKDLTARLRDWLQALPDLSDTVRALMTSVLRGFACVELTYHLQPDGSGRRVLLPTMTLRPHGWFTVDRDTRSRLGLRQLGLPDGEPLRPQNWVVHLHRAKNGLLPRQGLVRTLALPHLFKHFSERDLAELLEIYGIPIRVGKYPVGAGGDEKRALLQAVTQIGHNAAGIMPMGMQIELLKAAEGSEGPFMAMAERMDAIQSKVILGQTLSSSEGKHGTQALGKVHDGVRKDIRDDDALKIAATITGQLLRPMALLNMPSAAQLRLPRFVLETAEPEDLAAFAAALPSLVNIGLPVTVKWAAEKLQIPAPQEGEAVLQPEAKAVPAQPPLQRPGNGNGTAAVPAAHLLAQRAFAPVPAPGTDAMDLLIDEALADWEVMLAPMVEPLLAEIDKAVASGESLTSLRDRLPALLQVMDARPMAERLARSAFMARLCGAADLDLNAPPAGQE